MTNAEPRLVDGTTLNFINEGRALAQVLASRWRPGASRLWCYNLHYFDFLKDEAVAEGLQDKLAFELMASWCQCNPLATTDAWDPYPISLRVVNWIKYLHRVKLRGGDIPPWVFESLGLQINALEMTVEHHLRANHLFKNAVALFFSGTFFAGCDADRWRKKGFNLLSIELKAQFLEDGGHVERTPTYHALCIEDCLDCLNLAQAMPDVAPTVLRESLVATVIKGINCLRAMTLPDGSLAGFSDTAPGIAPGTEQLLEYAKCLAVLCPQRSGDDLALIELQDSGYYGYRRGSEHLLMDCGPMGVSYQPGHAHCDLLSFEWVLGAKKIIVDSGVFDYVDSPERQYCRSTAAHNTVMVDGQEQGEIWSAFRLGRRPNNYRAEVSVGEEGSCHLSGGHDAYAYLPGGVVHQRKIERFFDQGLVVSDELTGSGQHLAVTRFHFAAPYQLLERDGVLWLWEPDKGAVIKITFSSDLLVSITEADCFPAFGCRQRVAALELEWRGRLPASWKCCFEVLQQNVAVEAATVAISDLAKRGEC
ncbi:MAG: alginate lyase family protein [Gammaproteobacteria bacterium]|nr:alginate lyase family protein [Gammaproteobacteria bacterium]MBQ0840674.1 alginate lyase family protein [Gammaproteobacteria bacterium]